MRILSRYLLARFLGLLLAISVVVVAVISVAEILLHIEELLESGGGPAGAARYLALKLPAVYLRTLVPVVVFAAVFASVGLAARWRETTAMKAGGVSPMRVVAPLLAASALLSAASFAVNETVGIRAQRAWEHWEEGDDGDGEVVFRRGSFWYHRGNIIYNVRYADPETNTWRDVRLFEVSDRGRLLRSIRAEAARIEAQRRWRFFDVTVRRFDPRRPLAPPGFERLEETTLDVDHDAGHLLRHADASLLFLPELREYAEAAGGREGAPARRARAVLHERASDPFWVLLFALLAVPLGLRVEESRSLAVPALLGVLVATAALFGRALAAVLVREGVTPPALTSWTLLGGFAGFGLYRFARIPR